MSGAEPRSQRNHNPLNIECLPHNMKWAGQVGVDPGAGVSAGNFAIFADDAAGWACAYKLLLHYQQPQPEGHGCQTIADIIRIWAPGDDHNNPDGYAASVSEATGVGINDPIDLHDPALMMAVGNAMAHVEASTAVWDDGPKQAALVTAGLDELETGGSQAV